jgi:hypothetical protein
MRRFLILIGLFLIPVYFLVSILFSLVLMPAQGFAATEEAFHTPEVALAYAAESPLRALDDLRDLILAAGLVIGGAALYDGDEENEGDRYLQRAALVIAGLGAALLTGSAVAGFTALPVLVDQYSQAGVVVEGAYLALTLITGGMRWAGWIALGVWAGLISWAAQRTNRLPLIATILGIGLAAAGVLSLVLPDVAPVAIVVLGIIWPIWIGISYP